MKRTLALLLAIILLLSSFTGCKKTPSGDAEPEDTAAFEALYAPVLKKYKQALDENWSTEKFSAGNLSPLLARLDKAAEPHFAFLDLNGDKTPELFIGRADQPAAVYDLYTVSGNSIRQLVNTADEQVLTLTDDNLLAEDSAAYEHLDVTTFYELDGVVLAPADSYIRDAERIVDGENEWFRRAGELPQDETKFYADDMEIISEAEYTAAKNYKQGELRMRSFDTLAFETAETGLTAEDAVAIYASNRSVWDTDLPESAMWESSYSVIFLDLDFDGVLELVRNEYAGGSGLIDYNYFYRIDPATQTVVELKEHFGVGSESYNEGIGYEFYLPDADLDDIEPTPLLFRDTGTGEKRYFFHGTERSGFAEHWTYYGDLFLDGTTVNANELFLELYHDPSVFDDDEWTYYVFENGDDPVSGDVYEKARSEYLNRRADLHLNWVPVTKDELASAADASLRRLLLNAYRGFGYDGYEPIGGDEMEIEWYVPPITEDAAVDVYMRNQSLFSQDSALSTFIDLDGDGVMEVWQENWESYNASRTDNAYYQIDRETNRVVKVPVSGLATTFDSLHRRLKSKEDGSVLIFGEDFADLGSDQYERTFGTMRLTASGITSEPLFAKRYRLQVPREYSYEKSFVHLDGAPEYFYYENGVKTSTDEADYNARMNAFFEKYDSFTVGTGSYYYSSYDDDPREQMLLSYRCGAGVPMDSIALTDAPQVPSGDRGTLLTMNGGEEEKLDLFSYIYGGYPIMGFNEAQTDLDLLNFDYRDADATKKAYRHQSFGFLGTLNLDLFAEDYSDLVSVYEQYVSSVNLSPSDRFTRIPGSNVSNRELYDEPYITVDADFFDAMLSAGYNVAPDHSFAYSNIAYNSAYRQKIAYYDGGTYYIASPETGDITVTDWYVTDLKQNSDGSYTFFYHYGRGELDDFDSGTGYRETDVTELEITAGLKEIYGHRIWSLYQVKEVF